MTEQIGKVLVDYQYYDGTDQYSDGDIEDELLRIAGSCEEDQLNGVIAEKKDWAVLYHFSHIRQNIVESIPITKEQSVLEVGAGCGAVTPGLARKAGSVTCIDLSRKRCLINANRNRNMDNIRILAGNFQTIAARLQETFDVITLIGVFEYGRLYIDGEDPFVAFLSSMKKLLKPGGRIVIAIENKYGLKYWAGCQEDHTGGYFAGLEGYQKPDTAVTFSLEQLKAMIKKAGYGPVDVYYPYPDYKFPMAIYSDDYLPGRGELQNNLNNFDRDRLVLFNETNVYDQLIQDGLFPVFSNSYLLLVQSEES